MKNLLNKIFGVSQRSIGTVNEEGIVNVTKILSYDIVADPPFSNATFFDCRIQKELDRQELLKTRKEKIDKLNNL